MNSFDRETSFDSSVSARKFQKSIAGGLPNESPLCPYLLRVEQKEALILHSQKEPHHSFLR
jgi:hypothetical protein